MLNNLTIRQGLTLVIAIFAAFLLTVIGVGWGALKFTSDGLENVQQSSSAMHALTSSSEKLLQVRLALGSYETLFSVGKETDGLLAAAHKVLESSNEDFRTYMASPFGSDEERKLAQTVAQAHRARRPGDRAGTQGAHRQRLQYVPHDPGRNSRPLLRGLRESD